ncbi:MAG: FAD-dependent oxidoreductase [Deltaproteobacteria bacterium]|nr:FAD-dependent oxidoreductase [Deltaproteobacteria bacterium]
MRPINSEWLGTNLPCRSACPVGTHAGGYVSLISVGRFEEAYLMARRPNPFASICGRICAHPCEAACRRQFLDQPVSIRALKRFVTERLGVESERQLSKIRECVEQPRPKTEDGGQVAVVGAGPGGLSCAHDLALMGHQVVVFDAAPVAGGMMRLGIPEYRLPRELIASEVAFIESLGVDIRLGVEIGEEITFADLRSEYDAVFLAPGCRRGRGIPIDGVELDGVLTAVDFLMAANLNQPVTLGERVVVVGGGNVAFDVARTARRFGGTSAPDEPHHNLMVDAAMLAAKAFDREVTMVALEGLDELPADAEEIEEAEVENIRLLTRRGPKAILGEDGAVRALQTRDVARVFDDEGRFAPEYVEDSDREVECDTVVLAIGQVADLSFLGDDHGLAISPRSTIEVDRNTLATSVAGVFAGGDVAFGPRIVIEAVADGRRAALSIDSYLTGRSDARTSLRVRRLNTHGYEHPFATGDYEDIPRRPLQTLAASQRNRSAQVELVLTPDQARAEAARCLHCWVNTIFDSRAMQGTECIQCGGCVDVCPVDCIDLVRLTRIRRDDAHPLRTADGQPLAAVGPVGAALLKDETACIRCGLCARRCPVGCITMQGFYRADEAPLLAKCETSL